MSATLPPLPPVPGVQDADLHPGGPTITHLVGEDHRLLAGLLNDLDGAALDDPRLGARTSALVASACRHLAAEEQYLFPALRAVLPDGPAVADREVAGNQALRYALRQLERGPATDLTGLAEVQATLRAHIRRCEADLLPALAQRAEPLDLIRLGNRMQIAAEAAPTRPHPDAPSQPPLNKLTDPLLGTWDKTRDLFGRRVSYAKDI